MEKNNKFQVMMMMKDKMDSNQLVIIDQRLDTVADEAVQSIMLTKTYDKVTTVLLSIFLGGLGVDRFYLKDTKLGIAKLVANISAAMVFFVGYITLIFSIVEQTLDYGGEVEGSSGLLVLGLIAVMGVGIWTFVDIFMSYKRCKEKNFAAIMSILSQYPDNRQGRNEYSNNNSNNGYNNNNYNNSSNNDRQNIFGSDANSTNNNDRYNTSGSNDGRYNNNGNEAPRRNRDINSDPYSDSYSRKDDEIGDDPYARKSDKSNDIFH